jgi:hypothetical protein
MITNVKNFLSNVVHRIMDQVYPTTSVITYQDLYCNKNRLLEYMKQDIVYPKFTTKDKAILSLENNDSSLQSIINKIKENTALSHHKDRIVAILETLEANKSEFVFHIFDYIEVSYKDLPLLQVHNTRLEQSVHRRVRIDMAYLQEQYMKKRRGEDVYSYMVKFNTMLALLAFTTMTILFTK